MKKILIFFMLFSLFGQSCKKELSRAVKSEDKPQVDIELSDDEKNDDDRNDLEDLANPDKNENTVYSFGGVAGLYFGSISTFMVSDKASLEITLGTSLTTNLKWSQSEFEKLIRTGERKFGSLGSFSTFPQLQADRVEISFTDKHEKRWCSTRITEQKTNHGIEVSVKIEQARSKFIIDDIHKVEVAAETEGYRIKGHFECVLYEVNGDARKKIKGRFTGIVSPHN